MSDNKEDKVKKVKKSNPKSGKAVNSQRVTEVQALLLEGFTRSSILQYASKKRWSVSDRSVDEYISKAWLNIKEINQATLQENMAIITGKLWEVYRKASKAQDLTEQRQALMAIAKIKGLDTLNVNMVVEDQRELAQMSDQELDQILSQKVH